MDNFQFVDLLVIPLDGLRQVILLHRRAIAAGSVAGLVVGSWL